MAHFDVKEPERRRITALAARQRVLADLEGVVRDAAAVRDGVATMRRVMKSSLVLRHSLTTLQLEPSLAGTLKPSIRAA